MKTTTRREFLSLTASSLALLVGGSALWTPHGSRAAEKGREFLMLCDSDADVAVASDAVTVTHPGTLKGLDVANNKSFAVDLPFFGHTVTQNPAKTNQVVTFEKWGKRGALVDVHDWSVVTMAESTEGNIFFGHAAFTADGSTLIVSEDSYGHNDGHLAVRDASNLKPIRTLSSFGVRPHQCQLLDDNKTILVVNGGSHEVKDSKNLAWVDLETGKLIHKVVFDLMLPGHLTRPVAAAYGHFDVSFDNWVCCGGRGIEKSTGSTAKKDTNKDPYADLHATIAFVSPEGTLHYPDLPQGLAANLHGEALSVKVLGNSGLVAVSIMHGNKCLVLDYKTQELKDVIRLPGSLGVASLPDEDNGQHHLIISSKDGLFEASLLPKTQPHVSTYSEELKGIGSHLTRIYV